MKSIKINIRTLLKSFFIVFLLFISLDIGIYAKDIYYEADVNSEHQADIVTYVVFRQGDPLGTHSKWTKTQDSTSSYYRSYLVTGGSDYYNSYGIGFSRK